MPELATRYARVSDAELLIDIANSVQAALTQSGSLQKLESLSQADIEQASISHHCFLIDEPQSRDGILGCAFLRPLSSEACVSHELGNKALATISHLPRPWLYFHSVMLQPASQGRGIGVRLIDDFIGALEQNEGREGGTVLLNCWAGNEKLRAFYTRAGFTFLAIVPKLDYEIAIFHKQLGRVG